MRDKLIELISSVEYGHSGSKIGKNFQRGFIERIADHLISHGVTVGDVPETNVGKWIPVSERLPEPFVSVLVQMPGEEPCPTVREGFMTNDGDWYAGYFARLKDEVSHWMPMPEFHSKEEQNDS